MKRRWTVGLAALLAIAIGLFTQGDVGAATLTTNAKINLFAKLANVAGNTTAGAELSVIKEVSLANGVAAGQADKVYSVTLSVTTGATTDVDVQAALLDAFGAAFTPAKLKLVYIASAAANTTNLTLFGDTNSVPILNTAATTATLEPGGVFLLVRPTLAGIAVTAGTGDIIQIANAAGATASVDLVLVGTSS